MNVLIFATHDITPEQWASFTKQASIPPPTHYAGGPTAPLAPYVLVYSRSQGDCVSPTGGSLATMVKTEFRNATYSEMSEFIDATIAALAQEQVNRLFQRFFMVLDEQSVEDRKVTIVHKGLEWVDAEGNVDQGGLIGEGDVARRSVWKIHRVPYDRTVDFWLLLSVKPGMEGEEFLEEVRRPGS